MRNDEINVEFFGQLADHHELIANFQMWRYKSG
jgi:hypothetical protein